MKRFIFSVVAVAVFFLGLGALVEKTGARFKSDEKALELVSKARKAIGGDAAIASVQSLRIVGNTTRTFAIDGSSKTAQTETEIALQFPDKFMKMSNSRSGDGNGLVEKSISKQVDVIVVGDAKDQMKVTLDGNATADGVRVAHKVVIKKDDGTVQELTGDEAKAWIESHHPEGAGAAHTIMLKKHADGSVEKVDGAPAGKFVVKADGPGEAHTIMLKKNADGTIEQVGGAQGEKVVVRSIDGASGTHTITLKKNADGTVEQVGGAEGGRVMVRRPDGAGATTWTSKDGKTIELDDKNVMFERRMDGGAMAMAHGGARQNDFLRTTLGLLLTAPQGMDVTYTLGGEGDVDGTACNIVNASFGGSSYKLYLSKASNLPVMMSFTGSKEPQVFTFRTKADGVDDTKDVMTFNRKVGGPAGDAEYSVKFSDYRSVNGVQLPYKWTQTVGGAADETFDVTRYEVNPSDIGERFKNQNVMVRTTKPDGH